MMFMVLGFRARFMAFGIWGLGFAGLGYWGPELGLRNQGLGYWFRV